ncbi:MAG: hypothetical protein WB626_12800 [Bacteroidota bacterium]
MNQESDRLVRNGVAGDVEDALGGILWAITPVVGTHQVSRATRLSLLCLVTLTLGGCATAPRRVTPPPPVDPEVRMWQTVENLQGVERYMAAYPAGRYMAAARSVMRDSPAVRQILKAGAGNRFLIPDDPSEVERLYRGMSPRWAYCLVSKNPAGAPKVEVLAGSLTTGVAIESRPGGLGALLRGRTGSSRLLGETTILGNGTILVFKDAVGFVQESDPADPLRFMLVYETGFVHIGGRGSVIDPGGNTVSLGGQ